MLRAVLLDWGNTLAHWELDPVLLMAGHEAGLAALGRDDLPPAEAFTKRYANAVLPLLLAQREDEVDYAALVRSVFSDAGCELSERETAAFLEAEHAVWRPAHRVGADILELLDGLRERGLRLALVSNVFDRPDLVEGMLAELGVAERLDAVVLSGEVGKRKPHPAMFERALAALRVRPQSAAHVGDRLREDVAGAAALGLRTIQAAWFVDEGAGGDPPADARATRPPDVLAFVDSWLALG